MIPQRLQLSGFLSYLDPVEVDFTRFDLACISGANGAGKSSLLDAITWALFGQARKNNDAIINSKAKQAEVIIDFTYEGNLYRIQRIKPSGKTGQLEFFVRAEDGSWRALTEATLSQTQKRIQSTLRMDYDTFINASFFLQGKADQFAQQKPGDRKRILSTILGLEVWEQYREEAAERRKEIEKENHSLQDRLNEIEAELNQEPERRRRLALLQDQQALVTATRQAQEKTLAALRKLEASLAEKRRSVALQEKQVQDTTKRLATLEAQISGRQAERDGHAALLADEAGIRAAHAAWQSARAEVERWNLQAGQFHQLTGQRAAHELSITTARTRLEADQQILQNQQRNIGALATQVVELQQKMAGLEARAADLTKRLENRAAIQSEINRLVESISDLNAEKTALKPKMDEIKKRIDGLAEASGSLCPLCGQPLTPAERDRLLIDLSAEGKTCGDRFREIGHSLLPNVQQQRTKQEAELTQLDGADQELRSIHRQLSGLQENLNHLQTQIQSWEQTGSPRLADLTEILEKRAYAEADQAALAELDAQLAALGYDVNAHKAALQAEQAGRDSENRLRAVENARSALQPLERELSDLTAQQTTLQAETQALQAEYERSRDTLQAQEADLPDPDEAEDHLRNLQEEENRLRTQIGAAMQNVNVLDTQKERKEQINTRRTELSLQIARLKSLERAFSKDGVPALLIEQALPEIEAQANDILDRISGGGMSVRFETQRAYADAKREDRKETLDIIISDAAGSREYELFSGGEAFRVNFAIRLALSRVLAQRAGARLQTLVIDEGFGSQDAEGRQRLIEAINLVRPEFARILVITHLEEMKDAFPARIEVEKTPRGSRVSVISA